MLILSRRQGKWDGRYGRAVGYAGDQLGVSVSGKIVAVIAESWALVGEASGAGLRPGPGDLVICKNGTIGTVTAGTGADGDIQVEVDGEVSSHAWWAIVLPVN